MNAVIYARFSSANQREESIEGQERDCRAYAERQGYQVVAVYADRAMTGTNDRRPDFQRMIRESAEGWFDVVICWKHDRFARNRYDAAVYKSRLLKNGVRVMYAMEAQSDGAEGIIIDSLMEGLAEYYSANLSENVKRGMRESALKRHHLGVSTYGYTLAPTGEFVIEPAQASVVARIFRDYVSGVPSKAIMDSLNREGLRYYTGKEWNYNAIYRVLNNRKYIGVYSYGDIVDEGAVPAIVDKETFEKAQEMLSKHKKAPRSKQTEGGYLLTGKLFCGECGEAMTSGGGKGKLGEYYQYYTCNAARKHKCSKKSVPKDLLEEAVVGELIRLVHTDEMIEEFADKFIVWQDNEVKNIDDPYTPRLREVERQIGNGMKVVLEGWKNEELLKKIEELQQEKKELEISIGEEKKKNRLITREEVVAFLHSFRDGDIDSFRYKRHLVNTFLNAVWVYDNGEVLLKLNFSGKNEFRMKVSNMKPGVQPTENNSNPCFLVIRLFSNK